MFVLQLKSADLYVTLFFIVAVLCVASAKDEGPSKKEVKNIDPKDSPKEGGKDGDSKNIPKEDDKDTDTNDLSKEDDKDTDTKDLSKEDTMDKDSKDSAKDVVIPDEPQKVENLTAKEAENMTVFLSPEEGCDFLGLGALFDNPDHYKDLIQDYIAMEHLGYWEMRCEEYGSTDDNINDDGKNTDVKKPPYCG